MAWWAVLLGVGAILLWVVVFIVGRGPADCASEAGVRPDNSSHPCPLPRRGIAAPSESPAAPEVAASALKSRFVSTAPAVALDRHRQGRDLFRYDERAPLEVRREAPPIQLADGAISRLELSFASPLGGRVPATVLVPRGSKSMPGLVVQHGLPGSRLDTLRLAEVFARAGAVTVSLDAPFARRPRGQANPVTFTRRDRREQIQLIVDLRRAVDLLIARDDVDPSRIGYLGGSYGGAMGGLLAGVEDRISAYVLQVGDGGLVEHFTGADDTNGPLQHLLPRRVKGWLAFMEPIEPLYFVRYSKPAELLFQNGLEDELVPPSDALRFQRAGGEPKDTMWYAAGHGLGIEAECDAARWLQTRLRFSDAAFDACM
nr:hypothetical protein [uncultured bacterium]